MNKILTCHTPIHILDNKPIGQTIVVSGTINMNGDDGGANRSYANGYINYRFELEATTPIYLHFVDADFIARNSKGKPQYGFHARILGISGEPYRHSDQYWGEVDDVKTLEFSGGKITASFDFVKSVGYHGDTKHVSGSGEYHLKGGEKSDYFHAWSVGASTVWNTVIPNMMGGDKPFEYDHGLSMDSWGLPSSDPTFWFRMHQAPMGSFGVIDIYYNERIHYQITYGFNLESLF